jgi:hypothetical protein
MQGEGSPDLLHVCHSSALQKTQQMTALGPSLGLVLYNSETKSGFYAFKWLEKAVQRSFMTPKSI